jgi:PEP-CTERM motif
MGLVFGPNRNLFASSGADSSSPTEVLEYNGTTGAFVTDFVTSGSGGLFGPRGLVFGPNGNLFVNSASSNNVLKYNGTTEAFITEFVTSGSGGLDGSSFLAFSAAAVPEPSSLLLGLGCATLGAWRWRRCNAGEWDVSSLESLKHLYERERVIDQHDVAAIHPHRRGSKTLDSSICGSSQPSCPKTSFGLIVAQPKCRPESTRRSPDSRPLPGRYVGVRAVRRCSAENTVPPANLDAVARHRSCPTSRERVVDRNTVRTAGR